MIRKLLFRRGKDEAMPNMGFWIMSRILKLREPFRDIEGKLKMSGIKEGQTVLDYGCGIGSFAIPASKMVGDDGVVYALDIHPLARKTIKKEAKKRRISNIKTILSGRETGLSNESVDVILLYDTFHMIRDKEKLLRELHRVLKSDGILSIDAEHMKVDEFLNILAKANLFSLIEQEGKLFKFRRGQVSDGHLRAILDRRRTMGEMLIRDAKNQYREAIIVREVEIERRLLPIYQGIV